MQTTLFAAAGIAEAAWAEAMMVMWYGLIGIGCGAIVGLAMRSRTAVVASLLLCGMFTAFFQPWFCFAPFPPEAYHDPDVVSAAAGFHQVGIGWIWTGVFVVACLLVSLCMRTRSQREIREIDVETDAGAICKDSDDLQLHDAQRFGIVTVGSSVDTRIIRQSECEGTTTRGKSGAK